MKQLVLILLVVVFSLSEVARVVAQSTTSGISGTVTDESGAVVGETLIVARHVSTGRERSTLTDAAGHYRLPLLALGEYEVTATRAGFRSSRHESVILELDREAVVHHVLQVGVQTEQAVVVGEARTIEAAPSALTTLVDTRQVQELPLNGRDYIQLATLQAGAPLHRAQVRNENTGFGVQVSISGSRPTQNNFQLDGISMVSYNGSSPGSINGVNLGVDAVQEFSVHSSAFSAQYGRASGGIINAVTRSGGNDFHGTAFYFHRNDNLDARNFFDQGPPPEFRRHQFGGALGGPLVRDNLFFFVNVEALREVRGHTTINTTISEAARRGELVDGTVPVDPVMSRVLDLYPLPNGEVFGDTGFFIFSNDVVAQEDFLTLRIDHNLGSADKLFFRYSLDDGVRTDESDFAIGRQSNSTQMQSGVVSHLHIFSPGVLNSARFGVLHTDTLVGAMISELAGTDDPGLAFLPTENVIGSIVSPALSDFPGGSGAPDVDDHVFNSFQMSDDLTWIRGRHAVKMGGRFEHTQFNTDTQNTSSGEYQFRTIAALVANQASRFRAQLPGSDTARRHRQWIGALYLQDTWNVTGQFTLDFGVRWEWATVPTEVDGKVANLDNLADTEMRVGDPLFDNPSLGNVAPRIGVAWDPFGDGKTVVRSGYGIYPDLILSHHLIVAAVRNPPFYQRATVRDLGPGSLPSLGFEEIAAGGPAELRVERFPRDTQQPTVQHWNLIVERSLDSLHSVRVGYVGSRGRNLVSMVEDANLVEPTIQEDGRLFFPEDGERINSVFGRIRDRRFEADSFYHALNAQFRRRFSEGLQAQVSYRFSKSIDDSSNFFSTSEGANSISLPVNGLPRFNRGLSAHDMRHNFVANAVWELPLRAAPGWRRLLSDWQASTIVVYASGQPTSVRLGYDAARTRTSSNDAESGQRPNLVPGRSANPVTGDPNGWVDVSAFTVPAPGFLGNLGRNTLIGPDLMTVDLALVKRIHLRRPGDGVSIDFRFEAFNLFNRTNFDLPVVDRMGIFGEDGILEDAGRITSAGPSRELQFGLKLRF